MEYSLKENEYIELNRLIKYIKWAVNGGEANQMISNGEIKVNQEKEFKRRCKIRVGAVVSFYGETCTVIA